MAKLKVNWSSVLEYTESNVLGYAPKKGGVYGLSYESGDEFPMFYVGQASDLQERLLQHLSVSEPDACIKNHVRNYKCYFRYAKVASIDDRNGVERALYDHSNKPTCNVITPLGPPIDINFEDD